MPETSRPRIAVSVSREAPSPDRHLFKNLPLQYIEQGMVQALARGGCQPLLVPDLEDEALTATALDGFDGLVLSGGSDVAPASYGATPLRADWAGDQPRDRYEFALLRAALERGLPVLGICRGCQVINVACGGTLWQDIETQVSGALRHRDSELYAKLSHPVEVEASSRLAAVLGATSLTVNSVHHQAVRDVGRGLRVVARAPCGVVEAVEGEGGFLLGVQWHPEWLDGVNPVLSAFVRAAEA